MTKKLSIFVTALFLVTMIFAGTAMAAAPSTWTDETVLVSNASKPTVCYDGTTYHMWYLSGGTMYYQTSANLTTWSTAEACDYSLTTYADNAFIIKTGESSFYLWCTDKAGTQIVRLSSADGKTWENEETVLEKGVAGAWDAAKIDHPMVIKDSETSYKLYYQGASSDGTYSIGLATADSLVGTFARDGSDPVLTASSGGSDWDNYRVFQPWVVQNGSDYYMFYAGSHPNYGPVGIGVGTSADGKVWTKQERILSNGTAVCAHPAVTHKDGIWHIWYLKGSDIYHATASSNSSIIGVTFEVTAVGDPTYPEIIGVSVPPTLAIGAIGTGQTTTRDLTITNTGNVAVKATCTVSGETLGSVSVTNLPESIAVNGTADATVTVKAGTTPGAGSATITVAATAVTP